MFLTSVDCTLGNCHDLYRLTMPRHDKPYLAMPLQYFVRHTMPGLALTIYICNETFMHDVSATGLDFAGSIGTH